MATKIYLINSNQALYGDYEFSPIQTELYSEGVFDQNNLNNDLQVTEKAGTPDLSVDIATGGVLIQYTKDTRTWGVICENCDPLNLAVTPNASGDVRVDAVVVHLTQDEPNAQKNNVGVIQIIDGTGNTALTDGDIDTALGDNNWYRIANINTPDGATQILNADISDTRSPISVGLNQGGYETPLQGNGSQLTGVVHDLVDNDILPDTGSTHKVGDTGNTFSEGHFDVLYGDGSNLTNLQPSAITYTAGEAIDGTVTPKAVYLSSVDNKVYMTDATYQDERVLGFIGFVSSSVVADDHVVVVNDGNIATSAFSTVIPVTEKIDQRADRTSNEDAFVMNSLADRYSQGFRTGGRTSNLTKINCRLTFTGGAGTMNAEIYEMADDGTPTGAVLGTSNTIVDLGGGIWEGVFATPVELEPNTTYCLVFVPLTIGGTIRLQGFNGNAGTGQMYGITGGPDNGSLQTIRYDSDDSGATWNLQLGNNQIFFRTYTTQESPSIGDQLFLGETPGEVTTEKPVTGRSIDRVVGVIIDTDKFTTKIDTKVVGTARFVSGGNADTGSPDDSVYVNIPSGTKKIYATIKNNTDNLVLNYGVYILGETQTGALAINNGIQVFDDNIVEVRIGDSAAYNYTANIVFTT